MQDAEHMNLFL